MTSSISEQAPKLLDAIQLKKLSRMLRSMSRRWPNTRLLVTLGDFGVQLDDGRYLHIVRSGNWTAADMRDLLVLFATWLVVEPEKLMRDGELLSGVSVAESAQK